MNRKRRLIPAVLLMTLFMGATAFAQAVTPPPAPVTSIKLNVVLSRYEGDRRLNSQPYTLILVPNENGNIRTGAEVAVPTTIVSPPGGTTAYTLQQVGTQIDANVTPTSDGKYKLRLTVTDRSMLTGTQASQLGERVPNVPTFRNNTSASNAIMSNGETIQFTTVVDKVTNETFRIDVTLTVGNK